MGYGDELILSGALKKAYQKVKRPIALGRYGKNYFDGECIWGDIFENNPKIDRNPGIGAIWLDEIKKNRPYIDYNLTAINKNHKVIYKKYHPEPGEIFFNDEELSLFPEYEGYIYIEPNVKGTFGGNKDWGFEKWQEVVKRLPYRFVQGIGKVKLATKPPRPLDGVSQVNTKDFRQACALLRRCSMYVGPDGGLHHAAAALGKPAVVVWGGLVGPDSLGYDFHVNLRGKGVQNCGSEGPCEHCKQAMALVSVEDVVNAVRESVEAGKDVRAGLPADKDSGGHDPPEGDSQNASRA